jgi:uncharacterized protein
MGPKSYEQCAGFLKIPESADPLDNTWVHPENYEIARLIREKITGVASDAAAGNSRTTTGNLNTAEITALKEKYSVGDTTINDIVEELKKPNRDPRDGYPKPIMQKGVVTFEDLHEGMMITGKIKNVVDFGAFVDLGIKETALVHISELSDAYVKDPMDVIKVGDVFEFRIISLDLDRRRIGLSRKSGTAPAGNNAPQSGPHSGPHGSHSRDAPVTAGRTAKAEAGAAGKKRLVAVKAGSGGAPQRPGGGGERGRPAKEDDGTMYNPFAEAFRKMQEDKGGTRKR